MTIATIVLSLLLGIGASKLMQTMTPEKMEQIESQRKNDEVK